MPRPESRQRLSLRPGVFQPRFATGPRKTLAATISRKIDALDYSSSARTKAGFRRLGLKPQDLAASLERVYGQSVRQGSLFARAAAASWKTDDEALEHSQALMNWARGADQNRRQMVCRALAEQRRGILVVHNIGGMSRSDARTLMRDFLLSGGKITNVLEGLGEAGSFLHRNDPTRAGTDGLWDSIKKLGKKAVNWVKGAIKTVGDALQAAGKSLAGAIKSVAGWTVGKLTDLVRGLVRAGRRVADILTEAARRGTATLRKFVQAVIQAGRSIGEVFSWAIRETTGIIREAVSQMIKAGKKVADIVREAARYTGSLLGKAIQAIYGAVRRTAEILQQFARRAVGTIRMVLEGLFRAGLSFGRAVGDILRNVGRGFQKGFFQGLLALGKSVADIMVEALKLGGALVALALSTILDILGGYRPLKAAEIREARRVFGFSIDLSRVKVAAASLPVDLVHKINGGRPFTTMYLINFASWQKVDMATLIHEMTHVWQGVVAGPVYMVEALHAQIKHGSGAYRVTNDMLDRNGGDFSKFNREQQAVIVESYWQEKWGSGSSGLDLARLEPYAKKVYRPRRGSIRFGSLVPTGLRAATTFQPAALAVKAPVGRLGN